MPINTDPAFIGRAWITPDDDVVAGAMGTWTITYEVGAYGYDERARLKIAERFASDWGTPQFTDAKARNYATVRLETKSATAVASISYESRGMIRPWFKCLVVSLADGSLLPGDKIHVTLGDTSGGGPGSRAQTFCIGGTGPDFRQREGRGGGSEKGCSVKRPFVPPTLWTKLLLMCPDRTGWMSNFGMQPTACGRG